MRLRLTRVGSRKNPVWRVVAADGRAKRDGRVLETVGRYNPQRQPSEIVLDRERIDHWLARGAQPSDTVRKLIRAVERGAPPESATVAEPARAAAATGDVAEGDAGAAGDGEVAAEDTAGGEETGPEATTGGEEAASEATGRGDGTEPAATAGDAEAPPEANPGDAVIAEEAGGDAAAAEESASIAEAAPADETEG